MFEEFQTYVHQHKLCRKEDHIFLAVSGGIDSMVMLDLFGRGDYNFTVVHCNFMLRGKDSDADERFVERLADDYGIKVMIKKFDTAAYASESGLSHQMAARELRYNWFEEILSDKENARLATAHHLNDQLETVLFNIARGTGINGLSGIPMKVNKIIRPLLFASRREIEAYANERNISWREDASNESTKYQRNFLRHEIIPKLEMMNPSLLNVFSRTSVRLREADDLLKDMVMQFRNNHLRKEGDHYFLPLAKLEEKNPTFLELLLKPFKFTYTQCSDIFKAIQGGSTGAVFYTENHVVNIDRSDLLISRKTSSVEQKTILLKENDNGTIDNFGITVTDVDHYKIIPHPDIAALDFDKLKFPLTIRYWREGDRFVPLGMKGKKKLSDFLIDHKIAVNLKSRILVVESDGDIVWVVGYRLDDRYKITAKTKTVYQLQWLS